MHSAEPKKKTPLTLEQIQARFFWGVLLIAIGFLVALSALILRPSYCPEGDEWTAQTYQHSAPTEYGAEERGNITAKKKVPTQDDKSNTYEKYKNSAAQGFLGVICSDTKVTDLVVAALTAFLAVFGWYQMRNTDYISKRAERAYLVPGPFFGIPNSDTYCTEEKKWLREHRATKSMFHGPWRMIVTNFGRTAAFSTKVEWGICPFIAFKFGESINDLLDKREFAEWRAQYMRPPDVFENIWGETNRHYQLRHCEIQDRDKVVWSIHFGRVEYMDVFKQVHHAAFANYMTEEGSDAIGPYLSKEHD